jgi:hypothetical protein
MEGEGHCIDEFIVALIDSTDTRQNFRVRLWNTETSIRKVVFDEQSWSELYDSKQSTLVRSYTNDFAWADCIWMSSVILAYTAIFRLHAMRSWVWFRTSFEDALNSSQRIRNSCTLHLSTLSKVVCERGFAYGTHSGKTFRSWYHARIQRHQAWIIKWTRNVHGLWTSWTRG